MVNAFPAILARFASGPVEPRSAIPEQMEIYTHIDREWPSDHPVLGELDRTEKSIYWSAVREGQYAVQKVEEYVDENGEVDPEDPELDQAQELLQDSLALAEMMDELAKWRKGGIIAEIPESPGERNDE